MGIAAYNRGTRCMSRQIDAAEWTRHNIEVVERLNSLPKGSAQVFQAGVIRNDGKYWWIMDYQSKGWASYGFSYLTIESLLAKWAIKITGYGKDECSRFYRYEPI